MHFCVVLPLATGSPKRATWICGAPVQHACWLGSTSVLKFMSFWPTSASQMYNETTNQIDTLFGYLDISKVTWTSSHLEPPHTLNRLTPWTSSHLEPPHTLNLITPWTSSHLTPYTSSAGRCKELRRTRRSKIHKFSKPSMKVQNKVLLEIHLFLSSCSHDMLLVVCPCSEWPQPPRPSPRDPRKVGCFNFNLARGLNKDDRVQYGILTFFKKCKRAAVAEHGIRRVIVSFVEDDEAATKVFEEDVEISCDAGFQRIRFTPLVAKWARKPHTNRGVCIYAKNEAERRYLSIYSLQNGNLREGRGRNASLSVIYEKNGLRAEPTCSFKYENKTCCRRTQVISIEEIGLSDLIAFPHEYDAFACMGYCLANRYQRSNPVRDGISFLQTTMRTCCRGTRFGSLYIVQYNEVGMPSFQSYDNMTILACQCSEAR